MMYYIFTLKFLTPVHFGDTANGGFLDKIAMSCGADTLFAALCQEAALQGQEAVKKLITKVEQRKIVLSSLMPYFCDEKNNKDMHFYLPKPMLNSETKVQAPKSFSEVKNLATQLKKQKKTGYIRASQMEAFLSSIKQGQIAELDAESFAVPYITSRVALRENQPNPYYVGSYVFVDNAGLYFVCGVQEDADIDFVENLLENLGYSGIGGKRSSGYGKFEVDKSELDETFSYYSRDKGDAQELAKMLNDKDSVLQMCIAHVCPVADDIAEVKKGTYKLIKRGGFIASPELVENIKRDSVYMLTDGSCFAKRLRGQMLVQHIDGVEHGIYRDGLGLFVGLRGEDDAAGK